VVTLIIALLVVSFAMMRLENRLAANAVEEANRMKVFADKAMEGLAVLEGERIVDANAVFWEMSGLAGPEAAQKLPIADIILGLSPDAACDRGTGFFETVMARPGCAPLDIEAALRRTSMSGRPCTLLVVRDISERKAAAARIAHLASHDPLTGVGNRLTFNRVMEERLEMVHIVRPLGLLCIDLDRFKPVNDLYGHIIGDTVLIEVTKRINALLQDSELLARLGGDEFAVLLRDCDARDAERTAQRILQALTEPILIDGSPVCANASIGVASCEEGDDLRTLLHAADTAMYAAKHEGKGTWMRYDHSMLAA
jgi:diguanylate cyclase (GGDEF)-like protein